jgi:ATP-dependent DNA ligase
MLAKAADSLPAGEGWLYEPKWDGFRCVVFRDGDHVELTSRNERPFTRYFPDLVAPLCAALAERCVVDGELVVPGPLGLDFDALQQRIHPAASRVQRLAAETPAAFIAFDLLAVDDRDLRAEPLAERRRLLHEAVRNKAPVHLGPSTTDVAVAETWFDRFEGAGLDGIVAKRLDGPYTPGERTMVKVKHQRTADCAVAGFRWHKDGVGIGSLLLGLYDDGGDLASVGVVGALPMERRRALFQELQPLVTTFEGHPWNWAEPEAGARTPRHSEFSRWSVGKDLSFVPLRPERVLEVRYEHMEGSRFRHTAQFSRWRPDRDPRSCTFAQLEEPVRFDLSEILRRG